MKSSLTDSWEAMGPRAMDCSVTATWVICGLPSLPVTGAPARVGDRLVVGGRLHQGGCGIGAEGLGRSLLDQDQGEDEAHGEDDIEGAPGQIYPEVTQLVGFPAGNSPDEGDHDGQPRGRAHEILHRQARHLGQVAHGGLAAVELPVGVGDEADGGVEGQVGRNRALARRVQGQELLDAQESVEDRRRP